MSSTLTREWDPLKHPRDAHGKFIEVLSHMLPGDKVKLPGGITVSKHAHEDGGHFYRVRAAGKVTRRQHEGAIAKAALDRSSQSTHPKSIGGKTSWISYRQYLQRRSGGEGVSTPKTPTGEEALKMVGAGRGKMEEIGTRLSAGAREKMKKVLKWVNGNPDHPLPPKINVGDLNDVRRGAGLRGRGSSTRGEHWSFGHNIGLKPDAELTTAAHEYGHHLDYTVLGDGITPGSRLANAVHPSEASQLETRAPGLQDVMQEINNSPEIGKLTALQQRRKQRYVTYLLKPHEMFARAYEQYVVNEIALQGGPEGLTTPEMSMYEARYRHPDIQVRKALDQLHLDAISSFMPTAWSDENFKPIKEAFDFMFARMKEQAGSEGGGNYQPWLYPKERPA